LVLATARRIEGTHLQSSDHTRLAAPNQQASTGWHGAASVWIKRQTWVRTTAPHRVIGEMTVDSITFHSKAAFMRRLKRDLSCKAQPMRIFHDCFALRWMAVTPTRMAMLQAPTDTQRAA
jgi:hypothetical protein